jgi:spermidine synthase
MAENKTPPELTGTGTPDRRIEIAKALDWRVILVLAALFTSGVASIINQVVWQRALKIFLGGSEALSSMVVVLVFMLGLGLGAVYMATRIHKWSHPLLAFGLIELLLAVINVSIAWLLSLDLSESVYAAQRLAVSAGIPLRLVYGVSALIVLLPPTFLMGITLPLASEVFQRQLGATQRNMIVVLFFLNTAGAALGAYAGSSYWLPHHGQRIALLAAVLGSVISAAILLALCLVVRSVGPRASASAEKVRRRGLSFDERLGGVLGFLSLGYEIYLFRLMALAHQPLPHTFAMTLCLYLLFWSLGVLVASRIKERAVLAAVVGSALIAVMPLFYELDRWGLHFQLLGAGLFYFVPCVLFGILYGFLVSRSAEHWGRDVARFYAVNTAGSCVGIVFFTLVGYETDQNWNAIFISAGLVVVGLQFWSRRSASSQTRRFNLPVGSTPRIVRLIAIAVGVAVFAVGFWSPVTVRDGVRSYWGRDGVVEIRPSGAIWIDGLWHSALSDGTNHIGAVYSWFMVIASYLSHGDSPISDALVVGSGVGLTAAGLTLIDGVNVDAYEINHTLKRVLEDYPEETLNFLDNDRIHIMWQDARSGLALNPKKYDIIISAPLHLRQAGSSILLSREYLSLVQSRLKPGGVVALYSHEGPRLQSLLVRSTVRSVFRYSNTFRGGIITVASDSPIQIDRAEISERLRKAGPIFEEVRFHEKRTGRSVSDAMDVPPLRSKLFGLVVTDDHPLVEYPRVLQAIVKELSRSRR